jgi:hypothetical protein
MNPPDVAQQIASDLRALPEQSTAPMRKVRRSWSSKLRNEPPNELLAVATDLCEQHGYRWIAYELIRFHPSALTLINKSNIEPFAGRMSSWSDVDQFSVLLAGPAWRAGQIGDDFIHAWAHSSDRWWRRAALVSTVPLNTRSQGGKGDIPRTLAVCELLLSRIIHRPR